MDWNKLFRILIVTLTTLYVINIVYARLTKPYSLWPYDGVYMLYPLLALLVVTALCSHRIDSSVVNIVYYIVIPLILLTPVFNTRYSFGKFDVWAHMSYSKHIIETGFLPDTGVYADLYRSTPLIQVFISELSLLTGLDTLTVIRLFQALFIITIIVATKAMVNLLSRYIAPLEHRVDAFLPILLVLFIPDVYGFRGTLAALPLFSITLYLIIATIIKKKIQYLATTITLIIAISFMHIPSLAILVAMSIILLPGIYIAKLFCRRESMFKVIDIRTLSLMSVMLAILLGIHIAYTEPGRGLASSLKDLVYRLYTLFVGEPFAVKRAYKRALITLDRYTLFYTVYVYIGRYILQTMLYMIIALIIAYMMFIKRDCNRYAIIYMLTIMLLPTYLSFIVFSLMYNIKVRFLSYIVLFMTTISIYLIDKLYVYRKTSIVLKTLFIVFFILSIPSTFYMQPLVPNYKGHGYLVDFSIDDNPYLIEAYKWVNTQISRDIGLRVSIILFPYIDWAIYYYVARDYHDNIAGFVYKDAVKKMDIVRGYTGLKLLIYFYPVKTFFHSYIYNITYNRNVLYRDNIVYNNGVAYVVDIETKVQYIE